MAMHLALAWVHKFFAHGLNEAAEEDNKGGMEREEGSKIKEYIKGGEEVERKRKKK